MNRKIYILYLRGVETGWNQNCVLDAIDMLAISGTLHPYTHPRVYLHAKASSQTTQELDSFHPKHLYSQWCHKANQQKFPFQLTKSLVMFLPLCPLTASNLTA